jgi:hypothetical protein
MLPTLVFLASVAVAAEPTPAQPAPPAEPAPAPAPPPAAPEPAPAEPAPTPTEPAPTEPAPTEPAPTEAPAPPEPPPVMAPVPVVPVEPAPMPAPLPTTTAGGPRRAVGLSLLALSAVAGGTSTALYVLSEQSRDDYAKVGKFEPNRMGRVEAEVEQTTGLLAGAGVSAGVSLAGAIGFMVVMPR